MDTPGEDGVRIVGFSIGVAAERAGMHPQTLREYERRGLIAPVRTSGGARRYAERELERLTRIQALTEQGLSLAAVAYVLELETRAEQLAAENAALRARLAEFIGNDTSDGSPEAAAKDTILDVDPSPVPGSALVHRRAVSVEIVHVPRQPRGTRWRNQHY